MTAMWDKAFTASLVAYATSSGLFVLGHYFLPEGSPVTIAGAALLGVTGLFLGVAGIGMVLALLFKAKARR